MPDVAQRYYQRTQTVDATTDTVIITALDQTDIDIVTLNIKNEHASTALDGCILQFKSHPDAGWVAVETSGWGTADNIVLSTANPVTLAANTETLVRFRTEGIYGWRILANANTSALGPVEVWGTGIGFQRGIVS